ncbi:MAG: proteasome activator [Actinomycetota bacterium]
MTEQPQETTSAEVAEAEEASASFVQAPKLMRIASMTRAMLEEIRQAPLDEAGRRRLVEIYDHTLAEMEDVLSEDLREELRGLFSPLSGDSATEAELRVAQAQLVGWLEGLFAGIQATLWSQQAAAASQLQQMRMRAIEAQGHAPSSEPAPGQYL